MHDLGLDCALTIRGTPKHAANQVLREFGLPEIQLRIAMDSGQAAIAVVGSSVPKQHRDLLGIAVSLAAKIQVMGLPGDILYGETVERNLHTNSRRHSCAIDLPPSWQYVAPDGSLYPVYRCTLM
jgi:class 3 adenylate cyclase